MSRHSNIVNSDELEWVTTGMEGTRFEGKRKSLSQATGAQKLGMSVYRLAPGKRGFPRHCHYANEEAIYILAGQGTATIGEVSVPVGAGDYIALPCGEAHAHQLENRGAGDLIYLCASTMIEPDVVGYPDSGKIGVFTGAAPGGDKAERQISGFWRKGESVVYLDGEQR